MEDAPREPKPLAPGSILDRYVILRQLPELAGPVYAAHDRQLDRTVALRMFTRSDTGLPEVLQEVREVAALSHPNLVAVHDVGTHEGGAFVATEYVGGTTLRAWIDEAKPGWPALRDAFEMVARGLAAAHAAGLFVGADLDAASLRDTGGRVRVGDLRRAPGSSALDEDQRRFGRVLAAALGSDAPAWLRRVAARADAVGFVDMGEVADALARGATRRRPPWALGLAGGLAIAAAVGIASTAGSRAPVCTGAERKLEGVWDEARRTRIAEAFEATGLPFASHAHAEVVRVLDGYTAAWIEMRRDACEATHVRREQSTRVLDLRMACLDQRLDALAALTSVLAEADSTVVERAARAAQALEDVERCADLDVLVDAAGSPTEPAIQAEVDALRTQLSQVKARADAGKYADAVAAVAELVERAERLDHAPILAEALRQSGVSQAAAGEPDLALTRLHRAVRVAWDGEHDRLAARIWLDLAHVAGEELSRDAEAERYLRFAEAAVERIGGDPSLRADLGFTRATVLNGQGHYEAALREYEQVLLLQQQIGGDDAIASIHNNMALALHSLGRHEEALANYEHAAAIWNQSLGPAHPDMATLHSNVGASLYARGRFAAARERMWRGYEIRIAALGPDHPRVAESLNNVGVVELQLGRYEDAEAHQRESLRIRELAVGPDHPDLAPTLLTLARISHLRGELARAREYWRRALAVTETGHGLDHPLVASVVNPIAHMLESEQAFEEALELRRRALAIEEASFGPGHPKVAQTLAFVAEDLLAAGRPREALGPALRAWQLVEGEAGTDDRAASVARTRFVLARALWADGSSERGEGSSREAALEHARAAERAFGEAGRVDEASEVEAWLAQR